MKPSKQAPHSETDPARPATPIDRPRSPEPPRNWYQRLVGDLRLALIGLFGMLGVVAIAPFAVFRFLSGDILIGLFDSLIVLGLAGGAVFAWRTNRLVAAGNFLVTVASTGCIAAVVVLELSPMWAFSTYLANFVVGGRRFATLFSLLILGIIGLYIPSFDSQVERLTFMAVSSMAILFALIFATRTEKQNDQLRHLALVDPLTGAGNRRAMQSELLAATEGVNPNNDPHALALLDLDHFKEVNDRLGHDAGDQKLVEFADLIREVVRRGDRVFRFGGEEFVVLLPGADRAGLEIAANKILEATRERLSGPDGPLTVSIGGAVLEPGHTPDQGLARADAALYRAKEQGRDRVDFEP